MRETICLLVIMVLGPGVALSQDLPGSDGADVGVSLGLAEYQIRENVLNRIRHRGTLASAGFFYERAGETTRQKIDFHVILSVLESRYESEGSSFAVNPSLEYRYARKVHDFSPDLGLFLGGIAGLEMHHEWFGDWDDSHLYWLTSYHLGVDGILTYRTSAGNTAVLEIDMPVLALVSRPPERFLYKVANPKVSWVIEELHSNMRLTSLHEHFVLTTNLSYRFSYTARFDQKVYWRASYTRNAMPYSKELRVLTHAFGVSFVF